MAEPLTIVGMSGGVDSSVAALLLQRQGLPVAGLFMKNWEEDDRDGACTAEADAADARAVAELLGLKLHTRNFADEYWDGVFEHFLAEYRAGRTPNPDILCNREIKFRTFLEHARDLGAECIATGHYARIDRKDGRWRLLRGLDAGKDQSYFLYTLGQQQLAVTRFPVGELHKSAVRELAREARLPTAAKRDSTGICFIGKRDFRAFLSRFLPAQPGEVRRVSDGQVIGKHQGLMFHTLGQRQGLGIGGVADAGPEPWYVVGKDLKANELWVDQGVESPWLYSHSLRAGDASWTDSQPLDAPLSCTAKTRYRQDDQPCRVLPLGGGQLHVDFEQPQRAVTPGQSVVFYAGEACVGGAIIEATDARLDPRRAEFAPTV